MTWPASQHSGSKTGWDGSAGNFIKTQKIKPLRYVHKFTKYILFTNIQRDFLIYITLKALKVLKAEMASLNIKSRWVRSSWTFTCALKNSNLQYTNKLVYGYWNTLL